MDNNDILVRLRYALDIKDTDMVEIFELGGIEVTKEQVLGMLTAIEDGHRSADTSSDITAKNWMLKCSDRMVESFLNGFIIFKRGNQEPKPGQTKGPTRSIKDGCVNNVLLKKLKIALALTSEDMLDIWEIAGVVVSKGELSAIFRKAGHRHYRECGDHYARNFLKGLTRKHRK